jgi:hypothetical protein
MSFGAKRRKVMDTSSFVNAFLLVVGMGLSLQRDALAGLFASEASSLGVGLARNEERAVWAGVILVAGLALVITALLRFFA